MELVREPSLLLEPKPATGTEMVQAYKPVREQESGVPLGRDTGAHRQQRSS